MFHGILSPILEPGGKPPERSIVARDFREWVERIHELIETRPHANYVWQAEDCGYLH